MPLYGPGLVAPAEKRAVAVLQGEGGLRVDERHPGLQRRERRQVGPEAASWPRHSCGNTPTKG
jgi:hypothetical protein